MLLEIENLSVEFDTDEGRLRVVDGLSLAIDKGEALGLVGESGSGKTVTALSILRLLPRPIARIASGAIRFEGADLARASLDELRRIRGERISMIFQDPMSCLSPLMRIGRQIEESLRLHRPEMSAGARRDAVLEWLGRVGLPAPADCARAWPHQLSGGMQQRAMIAMALILEPSLVIADEPTTALDVTIQAQVLRLMRALIVGRAALLLITHDMGVVWQMCSRVAVMYAARILESAPAETLFDHPEHPYTRGLLKAMPSARSRGKRLEAIPGQVPSPRNFPAGCRFHDRCPRAFGRCRREAPPLYTTPRGHAVRCFLLDPASSPHSPDPPGGAL